MKSIFEDAEWRELKGNDLFASFLPNRLFYNSAKRAAAIVIDQSRTGGDYALSKRAFDYVLAALDKGDKITDAYVVMKERNTTVVTACEPTASVAPRPPRLRSRVSNGSSLFVDPVDARTREARRFRDVLSEIVSDLAGPEGLSEGQRQLARRAALLSIQCEAMEAASVAGKPIDLETFGKLTDRIGRTFQRLGLRRRPKDITTLGQILTGGSP